LTQQQQNPLPVDLDELILQFGQESSFWQMQTGGLLLARARFADACRDAELQPVAGLVFEARCGALDAEHQQRFGLLTSALDLEPANRQLAAFAERGEAAAALQRLADLTCDLHLLTIDVLQQSDVRLEEFARHFCSRWELAVEGETAEASRQRLHDINFGRLMKEAEAVRATAEDRMAFLRELQEKEEQTRRPRRGKW